MKVLCYEDEGSGPMIVIRDVIVASDSAHSANEIDTLRRDRAELQRQLEHADAMYAQAAKGKQLMMAARDELAAKVVELEQRNGELLTQVDELQQACDTYAERKHNDKAEIAQLKQTSRVIRDLAHAMI
jgi:chromosome segregation ATPase